MDVRSVIEKLVQSGWVIRRHDLGEYDGHEYWLEKREGERLTAFDVQDLVKAGWLEPFNGGFKLSDAGRAAYMRSTDELGDGKLISPGASQGDGAG